MRDRMGWVASGVAVTICAVAAGCWSCMASAGDVVRGLRPFWATQQAYQLLHQSGVHGGLVVHLGCGDGQVTEALGIEDRYTVHGLEPDPARVESARRYIAAQGNYGRVSVEAFDGSSLPYADNLVNLVVVDAAGTVTQDELLRVLVPQGVAMVRDGNTWKKTVKPRPDNIDDWSHFLHDAGNNAVAADTMVGPPRSIQWIAPPLWLRSHETPSGVEALVTAGGRLFYYFDEGLMGITDQRLPERWSLIARDAFNGRLLWKRPLDSWGWPEWAGDKFEGIDWTEIRGARTVVPEENQRRLVTDGQRVYATLGYGGPMSILDAASGEILATVEETSPAEEILVADCFAVVHVKEPGERSAKRRGEPQKRSFLAAVRGDTAKLLWKIETRPIKPLLLAVDGGRVVYQGAERLTCLDLTTGRQLWETDAPKMGGRTLIVHDDVVLLYAQKGLLAWDASSGRSLWQQEVLPSSGSESPDLFVADGVVWRGMIPVDEELQPAGKSADAMAVGFDLRTGEKKKEVLVRELRSPEHHHRCYRNKATEQYIISGMEGAEFMDLTGEGHSQNNFLRGACKLGIMPANGLLYAPADQCFCQPGAKLLGFAAVAGESASRKAAVPDRDRLEKGPAYGRIDRAAEVSAEDWPTFRHDPARHGSTTAAVPANLTAAWQARLGGRLSQPVAVGDKVFVAACDAHTVYALDAQTGKTIWKYVAGARIDSPPTIHRGAVLFGSADGRVYCLRAEDGALAWRFLAAPTDLRIGYFDQIESVWPVHGSVLVHDDVVYATAGRSTYLDGGIRVYGLDWSTGKLLYQTTLEGPFPQLGQDREVGFYILGANSDVLVSEGGYLYMRQKKLSPQLETIDVPVLSEKGEQDTGLHVFSTAGLLDGSWYNRTFWMYSKRWPGFQLANQSPKSGQLLAVDGENTYAVHPFYRRNVHSPLFYPAKEGYLLFADKNTTEPQIVGEPGARTPVQWLPQSHIPREGNPGLDSPAFGLDKMIGYTRAERPLWAEYLPIRMRAMVKAGDTLFVAGPPDVLDPHDPYSSFEGRRGARLAAVSAQSGVRISELALASPPVFDGLIAAGGRLYVSLEDGTLRCFAGKDDR